MKMLTDMATIVVALCAIVVAGLVVRRELLPNPPVGVKSVDSWEELLSGGHVIGPPEADLRIVEFSDFQCPFCAQARETLMALRDSFPGRVAIVYRHFPLERIHPHAFDAALASECAGKQGRFESFHNALFEDQDGIGTRTWRSYAEEAAVPDLASFEWCVASGEFSKRIRFDLAAAERIGVSGTPSFIFDGKMVTGVTADKLLAKWIDDKID